MDEQKRKTIFKQTFKTVSSVYDNSAFLLMIVISLIIGFHDVARSADSKIVDEIRIQDRSIDEQTERCNKLSEEECFANDDCQGSYGPSISNGWISSDMVFKSCYPSRLTAEKIEKIKVACVDIRGELVKDKISGYLCLCAKPDYIGRYYCLEEFIRDVYNTTSLKNPSKQRVGESHSRNIGE